jgi:hypothetical protein
MSQAVLEKPILNDIDIGLVGDRKLLVFRFHSEDYRLIACRDTVDRRVLNILGIDINLTLYKHGH